MSLLPQNPKPTTLWGAIKEYFNTIMIGIIISIWFIMVELFENPPKWFTWLLYNRVTRWLVRHNFIS